jgi:hypothetical protein
MQRDNNAESSLESLRRGVAYNFNGLARRHSLRLRCVVVVSGSHKQCNPRIPNFASSRDDACRIFD